MANVRIRRAITYIALGATTSLGALTSARAAADDGAPAAAPRAMSAPPPMALHIAERLALPRTGMLAPMVLEMRAPATSGQANAATDENTQDATTGTVAQTPAPRLVLGEPGALKPARTLGPAPLTLVLGAPQDTAAASEAAAEPVVTAAPQAPVAQAATVDEAAEQALPPLTPVVAENAPLNGVAPLPVPEALIPQVEFWKRVYTQIDSRQGYLHDAWHLSVVYSTIDVPAGTRRQSVRGISREVSRVATILRNLAHGHRDNPSAEEAQVLAAWPKDVTNATLLEAARNVRFQTGQSDKFKAGLARARTWTPFIVSTFTAAGLPRELAALPHVESSFNMTAYSKVRAAGIWQFMPATARLFMHMDGTVDERLDPIRSTEGAARLLAQNYRLLGSWPLAITAYNHGPRGMHRAMTVTRSSDLAVIIGAYKTKHFGFASRNFYTELMAAWEVSQHPEKYFGQLPAEAPMQYETVTIDAFYRAKSVASALGVDLAVLREHNPALRATVWNSGRLIPRGFSMRVPRALVHGDMLAMLGAIPQGERFAHAEVAPRPMAITKHHPIAVAHLASARRFVAQRGKTVTAKHTTTTAAADAHKTTAVAGSVPWEQKATPEAPRTDAPRAGRAWYE